MSKVARELLKRQMIELQKDDASGFSVGLEDDSDWFNWRVCFEGPPDTIYQVRILACVATSMTL